MIFPKADFLYRAALSVDDKSDGPGWAVGHFGQSQYHVKRVITQIPNALIILYI